MPPSDARSKAALDALHAEARAAMEAVCRGEATAHADPSPDDVYAGDVEFKLSNGWTVVVFNDCDEWDYIDHIVAPDGRTIDIPRDRDGPEDANEWPEILFWHPQCEPHDGDSFCKHWGGK